MGSLVAFTPWQSANTTHLGFEGFAETQYPSTRNWLSPVTTSGLEPKLQNVVLDTVFRPLDDLGPVKAWILKAYLKYEANDVLVL